MKLKLRVNPITLYMLVLAAYGAGMFVFTVHKQRTGDLEAQLVEDIVSAAQEVPAGHIFSASHEVPAGHEVPVGHEVPAGHIVSAAQEVRRSADEGQIQKTVDNFRFAVDGRKPSKLDVSWLNSAQDFLDRVAVAEAECGHLHSGTQRVCGREHTVLGCSDADVAPSDASCDLHIVGSKLDDFPKDQEYHRECNVTHIQLNKNSNDHAKIKNNNLIFSSKSGSSLMFLKSEGESVKADASLQHRTSRLFLHLSGRVLDMNAVSQLLSSGLLLRTKQVLVEMRVNNELSIVPTLRNYWHQLHLLSSVGFKRVHLLSDVKNENIQMLLPTKKFCGTSKDEELDAVREKEPFSIEKSKLLNGRKIEFKKPSRAFETFSGVDDSNENVKRIVALYIYRPDFRSK